MTLRQSQAPGASTLTAPTSNGIDGGTDRVTSFSWEDWFRHATLQQRAEALGLAKKQGLVYPYQLSALTNGTKSSENGKATESGLAPWFSRLFAGKPDLQAIPKRESFQTFDKDLDAVQAEAVARALVTPDVFLLNGPVGTGKSRVVTEILAQAAARGWRSLFLARHAESLDVTLEPLSARADLFLLRYLDADEKSDRLAPCLRSQTSDEQKKAFRERLIAGAEVSKDAAESACRAFHQQETAWAALANALGRITEASGQLQSACSELAHVGEYVARDIESASGTVAAEIATAAVLHAGDIKGIDAELQSVTDVKTKLTAELHVVLARIAIIEPAFRAKTSVQVWSLSFWANLFNSNVVVEMESLTQRKAALETQHDGVARDAATLESRKSDSVRQFEAARQNRVAEEIAGRTKVLSDRIASTTIAVTDAESAWDSCVTQLRRRIERSDEAIAQSRRVWDQQRHVADQQCRFALQWTRFVEGAADSLAEKLPGFANLIAVTFGRWHADLKFHEAFTSPIDLLVIEDAEHLTEAEVLKLTRHAKKVVMVGTAQPEVLLPVSETKARPLNGSVVPAPSAWNRLWQTLSGAGNRSACTWKRVDGRLICQLQPLTAEDARFLETEMLVDSPDIELRILHRPRTRPSLAQMVFASRSEFVEAFLFMTREVQEFPLEPLSRTAWWSEDEKTICRWFGLPTHPVHEWVELERGLRLAFAPLTANQLPRVLVIEFDRSSGWDRRLADAWLHTHRAGGNSERTVYLQTPYRFMPELCNRLGELELGDWLPIEAGDTNTAGGIDFVAVPAMSNADWPSHGAGLEQDLTAPRHSDKLPSMLRTGLPSTGYANLYEAQAVIRRLEALVREEAPNATRAHFVVVALYEGQLELIRKLMEQSTLIKGRSRTIELTTPAKLRQRECDILIISLTRSHAHRAVPFGDDADDLKLALTRARRRIIVIGDPGTLQKRIQTTGAIDRRDGLSAAREQSLIGKIVKIARG